MMEKMTGKCAVMKEKNGFRITILSRLQTANDVKQEHQIYEKNIKRKTFLKFNGKM